jgi:hypothetical protein
MYHDRTYTVELTTGIKDLAGNRLAEGCSYTFRTED